MTEMSIQLIKEKLEEVTSNEDDFLSTLRRDKRKGVQKLVHTWEKNYEKKAQLKDQFFNMREYEEKYWKEGYQFIGGIDEVGRGPLAGPVVTSCVVLSKDFYLPGLTDSKKLSKLKRDEFYDFILANAVDVGIGMATAEEIDFHNIYQATKLAMKRAVEQIHVPVDYLLLDAMELPLNVPQTSLIKGDAKSISIAASSVIAKVTRDRYMEKMGETYPQYGFHNHMGYGTKEHIDAMAVHGITKEHRQSFAPVKEYCGLLNT
ncbi:ribonuclease HII [Evansella tamaricis]|uniref:Ribonuclease HII n=1 Tax=Evansella tamaricis TaxID=2069301 RepID=A0ABS6JLN5_9BACI|nr:ribonuclease HII [Evansella tamaricis]MBU9714574.1 ribonuclease HII [Evansella tamaricis]